MSDPAAPLCLSPQILGQLIYDNSAKVEKTIGHFRDAASKQEDDADIWELLAELLAPSDPAGDQGLGRGLLSGLGASCFRIWPRISRSCMLAPLDSAEAAFDQGTGPSVGQDHGSRRAFDQGLGPGVGQNHRSRA